ncbi:hypothetical protein ACFOJ6_11190 [Gordonia humi]|uniref:hypothetical protein n=1 Tax=Gordonia humi TaxID=686429 RepID=UPI00361236C6
MQSTTTGTPKYWPCSTRCSRGWTRTARSAAASSTRTASFSATPTIPHTRSSEQGKLWIKDLFAELTRAAGHPDPDSLSIQLLALIEGATVLRSISELPAALPEARRAAGILLRAQA